MPLVCRLNSPKPAAIGLALALAIVTFPAAAAPPQPFTITGRAICHPGDPTRSMSPAVELDWQAAPSATSYEVWTNGAFFTTIQAQGANSFEFTGRLSNGSTGTRYFVVAKNSAGTSTSNTVEITVPADICTTAPPVAVLSGNAKCDLQTHKPAVSLSWSIVPGVDGWQLYRDGSVYAVPHGSIFSDTNIVPGHTYTYNIATNALAAPLSNPITTTVSNAICVPDPVSVTFITFCDIFSKPAVRLEWSPSANASTYSVLRGTTTLVSEWTSPVYLDSTAEAGVTYSYQVIAANDIGSTPSPPVTVIVGNEICPPSSFTASALAICSNATPSVLLTWSASAHASSYVASRDGLAISGMLPATTKEFVDAPSVGLHSYNVKAANASGSQSASDSISFSGAVCGSAPGSFAASVIPFCNDGMPAARVQWSAASGAASYLLSRNGIALPFAWPSSVTRYDDTTVNIGQSYTYMVVASNTSGNKTAPAGTITPSVGDCPPGSFTLMATTACNPPVMLTWTRPSNDVVSYTIFRNLAPLTTVGATTPMFADDDTLPDGSYTYFVRAAGSGGASDSNIVTAKVDRASCEVPAPDLAALDIKPSAMSGRAGDTIAVNVELANVGRATAMATTARIRFGRGPSMSPTDPVLGTIALPAMGVGADIQRTMNVKLPAVAAGTYYLFFSLDEEHVSGETHFADDVKASGAFSLTDMIPPRRRAATH
jgi:hypothetical protein